MRLQYALIAGFLVTVCAGSPAYAQNQESYVDSNGVDSGTCAVTDPCQSFLVAHSKTLAGGSISCISAPVSALLTITKSITIDCTGVAFNGVHGGVEITVNLPSTDAFQTVRLRGFTINGAAIGGGTIGVQIEAAGTVILENMKIIHHTQQGVLDQRTTPGRLRISDSAISQNAGAGIVVAGASGNAAILDNVTSDGNSYGIAVAHGNNVTISHSTLSANSAAGVEGDPGAQIIVDNSTISHNHTGVQSVSSVVLSNNNIAFNNTAISGATSTYGSNRFSGNTSLGTTPTPLGPASSDVAQK
jgi:Right handed beta helix region